MRTVGIRLALQNRSGRRGNRMEGQSKRLGGARSLAGWEIFSPEEQSSLRAGAQMGCLEPAKSKILHSAQPGPEGFWSGMAIALSA